MRKKLTLTNKWEHGLGLLAATFLIGLVIWIPLWLYGRLWNWLLTQEDSWVYVLENLLSVLLCAYLLAAVPLIYYWMAGKIGYPYAIRKWSDEGRERIEGNQNKEARGQNMI